MEPRNQTIFKEFILVGYSQNIWVCIIFFLLLFLIYIVTIFGNVFVSMTIILSPRLHLPMYFFLCKLSLIDLCYSSSSLPKLLADIFATTRTVTVFGCLVQMNTSSFLGSTESFLLAVMAYDRYVAICLPLYYNNIVNWRVCRNVTIIMWAGSFLITIVPINSRSPVFCKDNKLDHFACEILAVLQLSCHNLNFYKVTIFVVTCFTIVLPLTFIVVSYVVIISAIIKIKSTGGRSKAFSTCVSHTIVVSMYYGTVLTMYMGQNQHFSSNLKYISLVYGILTPVLNPLIYSLRNKELIEAFLNIQNKFSLQRVI